MIKKLAFAGILAISLFTLTVWKMKDIARYKEHQPASLTEGKAGVSKLTKKQYSNGTLRFDDIQQRISPHLKKALESRGLTLGSPVFLRSFKDERVLELWMLNEQTAHYQHAHTWEVAGLSGTLGPKLKEGDKQSPEGFYHVSLSQFLPSSTNHLAFNVGYPNAYDRSLGRTGSFIMIHGRTGSVGCLAMTDPYIEEIYTICHAALRSGKQSQFQVQMLPFRLTEPNLNKHRDHQWYNFWLTLKQGYDHFEKHRQPPEVKVMNKQYAFHLP